MTKLDTLKDKVTKNTFEQQRLENKLASCLVEKSVMKEASHDTNEKLEKEKSSAAVAKEELKKAQASLCHEHEGHIQEQRSSIAARSQAETAPPLDTSRTCHNIIVLVIFSRPGRKMPSCNMAI
eukprot:13323451-Ditylum_brightwellii.AAC.1